MLNHPIFCALGGGQRVGASAYFLKLDDVNLLLDCGSSAENAHYIGPDLYRLIQPPLLESIYQLDQVVLSHAHSDHIGALPQIILDNPNVNIVATGLTAALTRYQLQGRLLPQYARLPRQQQESFLMATDHALSRIMTAGYMQALAFPHHSVTLFEAGHVPGAAMVYIETRQMRVLYTGDFAIEPTALTHGCLLPEWVQPDILIACGLHARNPNLPPAYPLAGIVSMTRLRLERGRSVYLHVRQLTKGIELLRALNDARMPYPIYVDPRVWETVHCLESYGVAMVTERTHPYQNGGMTTSAPFIAIGEAAQPPTADCFCVEASFSIHPRFEELATFIARLRPRVALVVHCANEREASNADASLARRVLELGADTQVLLAEDGVAYTLL